MAPPFYDHAGRTLDGRYELIERVGAGSFATVYRARDRNVHGRAVAVKVLHPERAGDEATVQRFLREVKLAVRSTGKHRDRLVQILDQGYCEAERPGLLYFVMEFVEGPTLHRLLREAPGGVFPWRRAVALGHEVAQALVTLHGHGVIHRDIKPGNCILEEDRVRLLDLGIAKLLPGHDSSGVVRLTLPNMVVGTLRYMAPEQQSGRECDARADLYAVGVMLYEFLTGGAPVLREQKDHPAANKPLVLVPPSVVAPAQNIPPGVDAVVVQALDWRLDGRFQSATDLAAALAATMIHDSTREWIGRPRRVLPARQRRLFAASHALGLWTLVAGTAVTTMTLALGVSLAHDDGRADAAALERDDSPALHGPADEPAPRRTAEAALADGATAVEAALVDGATAVEAAAERAQDGAGEEPGASTSEPAAAPETSPDDTTGGATSERDAGADARSSEPAKPSGWGRAALAARFATRRKQALAACGPLSGLTDPRGIKARVRVQVRPDGKVVARVQEPWSGTPLGECLEAAARATEFTATDEGGAFTWALQF
jgi:hypothetical protein